MYPLSYLAEYNRYFNFLGIAVIIGIAVLMSNNRRRIPWRLVATGLLLHSVLGWIVLKTGWGRAIIAPKIIQSVNARCGAGVILIRVTSATLWNTLMPMAIGRDCRNSWTVGRLEAKPTPS